MESDEFFLGLEFFQLVDDIAESEDLSTKKCVPSESMDLQPMSAPSATELHQQVHGLVMASWDSLLSGIGDGYLGSILLYVFWKVELLLDPLTVAMVSDHSWPIDLAFLQLLSMIQAYLVDFLHDLG